MLGSFRDPSPSATPRDYAPQGTQSPGAGWRCQGLVNSCSWDLLALRGPAFDLIDLAPTVLHEIVIVLHDVLEFLHVVTALPATLHHTLEIVHARYFHLGDERPVPFRTEVGHHAHLRHADLRAELGHGQELLNHRAHLTRLAIHDLANEQHAVLLFRSLHGFGLSGPPNGSRVSCERRGCQRKEGGAPAARIAAGAHVNGSPARSSAVHYIP